MKKSLVLAMAMALGVTASAYAANPFSDVPAGHWAYDSISKLAAAGVIEGYGDDTFRGDRLMTRYEMAQIVAKAMAKGANVDKLAAEFADELDALGVRVAALEKKADNVKITGQVRWSYQSNKNGDDKASRNRLRTRLIFNGKVNDNWNYVARLENNQFFHRTGKEAMSNTGEEETLMTYAYVNGRLGGMNVRAGRTWAYLGDGNIYDDKFDGIFLDYGKKFRIGAYYGKPTEAQTWGWNPEMDEAYGANLGVNLGKKLKLDAGYDRFKAATGDDLDIFNVNLYGRLADKFGLGVVYLHTDSDNKGYIADGAKKDGFVVTADIAGAKFTKPGSIGLQAKYYYAPAGSAVAHTMNGGGMGDMFTQGYKGYSLNASYTLAKNMMYSIQWYDLKGRQNDDKHQTLWNELQLRF